MNAQVRLTIVNDESEIATYLFEEARECYVGRSSDCDVQLPVIADKHEVSRHHCLFQIDPPAVWLQILDEKNRTFVNDLPIRTLPETPMIELRHGDEVRVGPFALLIDVDNVEEPSTMILAGHAASELNY